MINSNLNNKPRVIYVTASGASARSFLVRHFQVLSDRGYEVYLASSDDSEARDAVQQANIQHLPIPLKTHISIFSDILAVVRLYNYFRKYRPAIVHGHMSKAGLVSTLAATLCRVKFRIYHNHGMACFSARGITKVLLVAIEKTNCLLATEVVFCSESTKQLAIELRICNPKKARVIGGGTISGVNTSKYSPEHARNSSLQLINEFPLLSSKKKYVAFVGRVVAHKGIDTLIDAWRLIPEQTKSTHSLLIAGANDKNELFGRLRVLVDEDKSVHYLGRIDNISGLYGLLDILVLPSWHEGFPYSVLEAQSCGVPAVLTNVTGNKDAVVDGITGQLVDVKNAEILANSIENLLANKILLDEMRNSARQRIVENYDEDIVLNDLVDFYLGKIPLRQIKN